MAENEGEAEASQGRRPASAGDLLTVAFWKGTNTEGECSRIPERHRENPYRVADMLDVISIMIKLKVQRW